MLWNLVCRRDDNWKLSRGAYIFISIGLLLLLGAISAIIVIIQPWTVSLLHHIIESCSNWCVYVSNNFLFIMQQIGVAFLLVLLLLVLAIGVVQYWATNNFYLTRAQMFSVCFLAFLLALAAFLVGWFHGKSTLLHEVY